MKGVYVKLVYGVVLTVVIAIVARILGAAVPVLGAAPAALAIGVVVRIFMGESEAVAPGAKWASKRLLQTAIVFLGAGLSLSQIGGLGGLTFALIVAVVVVALAAITWIGRRMQLPRSVSTLIAVGTAICGASAIAATSPVIDAEEDETAYAISTIFTFNVIALFVYPILGHALGLTDKTFAIWAGTAIHDTASAVAGGYAFSDQAGIFATVVKLARTTLLVPVLLVLAAVHARAQGSESSASPWKSFPRFILLFVLAAVLRSASIIPVSVADALNTVAKFLIVVALAGVGLGTNLSRIRKTGVRPLLLGFAASVFISVVTLALALQLPGV